MAEYIYQMTKTHEAHGDKVIPDDVTMAFLPGAKIGMVGLNGAGESSILKIMVGIDQPSNGEARLISGYSVGILLQEPPLNEDKAVLGNVGEGVVEIKSRLDRYNEISTAMADSDADFDVLMTEMGTLQDTLDVVNAWDLDSQLEQAMDALCCPPSDAEVKYLSGGERRRVVLCKLLLETPDLLLLDEPTNHLDAESVLWLEQHSVSYQGAVIAVTYDRYFLDRVAEWTTEVDRDHLYSYEGSYSTYLETKERRLEVQGKKNVKLVKRLKEELEWMRSSARGRQAKFKARLVRYEEMTTKVERTRKLDFEKIQIPPGPRLGNQVLEATNLKKGFDGRTPIDGLSFTLPRNDTVGVVDPSGVGRSILSKTIVGLEPLDGGDLKIGQTIKSSYVNQSRVGTDPKETLWEVVSDGLDYIQVGSAEMPSHAYVAFSGFKGADQQKLTGVLSGGEHSRLSLALTLKQGGNLILLDEPTSDLDVETLGSLENALLGLPGCAVVITHDRRFLDRVTTHIPVREGTDENPASRYWFEENFTSYEENKVERLGLEVARLHRVTYRKLARD